MKPTSAAARIAWLAQHAEAFRLEVNDESSDRPSSITASITRSNGMAFNRALNFIPDDLSHAVGVIFQSIYEVWERNESINRRKKNHH